MNVVVFGAGGLLGRHVVEEFSRDNLAQVFEFDHSECDIGDLEQVIKCAQLGNILINCAAYTDVDGAEKNPDKARRVNTVGANNVASSAWQLSKGVVHVSTDYVFDGTGGPYNEFSIPNPQSVYARSKLAGDEAVLGFGNAYVVRTQGLYGHGGKGFASKLREKILAGESLNLDNERFVQPTWARSVARQIVKLVLKGGNLGIYNVSCKGETTWAGFACAMAEKLGVLWDVVRGSDAALPLTAPRPASSIFEHRMLEMHGIDIMPTWQDALSEYVCEEGEQK